jgi:acid stress-induced BolA-like protein IbaG/YrbA
MRNKIRKILKSKYPNSKIFIYSGKYDYYSIRVIDESFKDVSVLTRIKEVLGLLDHLDNIMSVEPVTKEEWDNRNF